MKHANFLSNVALYMFTYLKLLSLLILTCLIGCSSFHKKIQNAQIGLTKKQALKKFSEPQEKFRRKGQDHWIYETSKKAKDKSQGQIPYKYTLIFDDGVLINITFKRAFTNKELTEFYKN